MTQGAQVNLPVAGKMRGVQNGFVRGRVGMAFMQRNVPSTRTMAGLTANAGHKRCSVETIDFWTGRKLLRVSNVTLEASRRCWPIKDGWPVSITWAVDPLLSIGPIAHRQLVQSVAAPIKKALSADARANHDIDPFASRLHLPREASDGRDVEPVGTLLHLVGNARITDYWRRVGDLQHVASVCKGPQYRVLVRQLRSKVMRRVQIGETFLLMTCGA